MPIRKASSVIENSFLLRSSSRLGREVKGSFLGETLQGVSPGFPTGPQPLPNYSELARTSSPQPDNPNPSTAWKAWRRSGSRRLASDHTEHSSFLHGREIPAEASISSFYGGDAEALGGRLSCDRHMATHYDQCSSLSRPSLSSLRSYLSLLLYTLTI